MHAHTHTHSFSLSHTHILSHTHTHTHTLSLSHTHTQRGKSRETTIGTGIPQCLLQTNDTIIQCSHITCTYKNYVLHVHNYVHVVTTMTGSKINDILTAHLIPGDREGGWISL